MHDVLQRFHIFLKQREKEARESLRSDDSLIERHTDVINALIERRFE
jgi:hypothetical protein